jgi:hypothetical protein
MVCRLPEDRLPDEVLELIGSAVHRESQRGLRAAGALGADAQTVALIERAIGRWIEIEDEGDAEAKWRVQAGIRALGRSGCSEALPVLVRFLNNSQWSRYAADALGDLGGEQAAAALLAAFPRYARPAGPSVLRGSTHRAPGTHPSDAPHLDSRDRILAAPYAIAQSLARIPFRDPDSLAALRELTPLIVAQIPLDIDGLVVYDEEPFQHIFRHLLQRAGTRQSVLDARWAALGPTAAETPDWPRHRPRKADDQAAVRSPVLRGRDAPYRIEADLRAGPTCTWSSTTWTTTPWTAPTGPMRN